MSRVCVPRYIGRRLFICSRRINQWAPRFQFETRICPRHMTMHTAPVYPVRATFDTGCTRPGLVFKSGKPLCAPIIAAR